MHYLDRDGESARLTSRKLATARRRYIGTPAERRTMRFVQILSELYILQSTIEKERFEAGLEGRCTSRDANSKRERVL